MINLSSNSSFEVKLSNDEKLHVTPNFEFEDGTKIGELMRDGPGILLDFGTNSSLKTLSDEYAGQLKYVSSKAKDQLDLTAALIRPDGIIAWACDNEPNYKELKETILRWFN